MRCAGFCAPTSKAQKMKPLPTREAVIAFFRGLYKASGPIPTEALPIELAMRPCSSPLTYSGATVLAATETRIPPCEGTVEIARDGGLY